MAGKNNVLPIFVVIGGAVFLYSAVGNVGLSTEIRDLVSGKNPHKDTGTGPDAILQADTTSTVTGGKVVGTASSPGTKNTHAFQTALLTAIGAPLTADNYRFLTAWMGHENTAAKNNPFATTEPMSGATIFNSVGVRNYPTAAIGGIATARTLLNGLYGDIVAALRSGHPKLGQRYNGLYIWSGHGYSSVG